MKGIGILPNLEKEGSLELSLNLLAWLSRRGRRGVLPPCLARLMGAESSALPVGEWADNVDFSVVLGGDGTLLAAARCLGPLGIPLLGVNLGHFGFLTELETQNMWEALPEFLHGQGVEDRRMTLAWVVRRGDLTVAKGIALNDVCVIKGPYGRMTTLSLYVSGEPVDTYFGDGLIIATPTGSTAYSLSAGGPLLAPHLDALVISPICPHTLYSRSLVVESGETCEIEVSQPCQYTVLSVDGQEFVPLCQGDRVVVTKSQVVVALLRRRNWRFYGVLRAKMKEGADRLPR